MHMRFAAPVAIVALLGACSNGAPVMAPRTATSARGVALSFAAKGTTASTAPSGARFSIMVGSGADAVTIDTAQVVVRKVELKRGVSTCAAAPDPSDDCEELEIGPLLVDVPLAGGVATPLTAAVPSGTYREIAFELRPVSGRDSSDAAFRTRYPQMAGASVRVTGTYQGKRFILTSAAGAEMEMEFNPPVVVDSTAASNVTVNIDVASWFRDAAGAPIAPTDANAPVIAQRIKRSFRAFKDNDRNGDDDRN